MAHKFANGGCWNQVNAQSATIHEALGIKVRV